MEDYLNTTLNHYIPVLSEWEQRYFPYSQHFMWFIRIQSEDTVIGVASLYLVMYTVYAVLVLIQVGTSTSFCTRNGTVCSFLAFYIQIKTQIESFGAGLLFIPWVSDFITSLSLLKQTGALYLFQYRIFVSK